MIAEFIDHHDARWKSFLKRTKHDFYHLPEYAELTAANEGATPVAFYAEEGEATFLAPLLIRQIPEVLNAPSDWYDCVSPYGYPTPLVNSPQAPLESFLETFCLAARQRGLVTALFRLHPLLLLDHEILGKFGQVTNHGQTVYIDLAEPVGEIWIRQNHKRNIRKLLSLDFSVSLDEWRLFKDFVEIYLATMRRVEAMQRYLFSEEYFENLRAVLGERLHLCSVLSPRGDVAAAGLFVETDGIVEFHLSGTADEYLALAPSKLMFNFMRHWAQERSNSLLHLGGGVGGAEDSLFHFKAGFSPARGQFYTYRVVVDESKNATLNQAAESVRRVCGLESSNFFPGYRHLAK